MRNQASALTEEIRSPGENGGGVGPSAGAPTAGAGSAPQAAGESRVTGTEVADSQDAIAEAARRQAVWWAVTRLLLPVLVALVVVEAHETVITGMVHGRARDHLVHDFAASAPSATVVGRAHGALQIPSAGINEIVIEGDSDVNLRAGPAHRAATAPMGDVGNTVILGHFHRYGGPFRALERVKQGDPVFAQLRNGPVQQFIVTSVVRVGGGASRLLAPSTDVRLTLVTSAGRFTSDRLVVTAVLGTAGELADDARGFEPRRPAVIFSPGMGGAYLAVLAGLASLAWLRGRHRLGLALALSAPALFVGVILGLRNLELLLPATL